MSKLKEEIKTAETSHQKEISKATTILDRDNWELRRKMDKLSDAHMEEIDALKISHNDEIGMQCMHFCIFCVCRVGETGK